MGDDAEPHVELVGSRHPVLDALATVTVVPNDISLSASGCRVRVITGCVQQSTSAEPVGSYSVSEL